MVLRATRPRVVRSLVVVPDHDPRHFCVQRLQVRVGLVLRVPDAVVGETHDLVSGLVRPDAPATGDGELPGRVLVQIVAEVHHGVEIVACGEVAVGGEEAAFPVGARDDTEAQASDRSVVRGRGGRPAGRGDGSADAESIEVGRVRCEPAGVDLDRVVGDGTRRHGPARDHRVEAAAAGDLPRDREVRSRTRAGCRLRRGCHPGPQDHRVGQGISRGHAVREDRGGCLRVLCGRGEGRSTRGEDRRPEHGAAGDMIGGRCRGHDQDPTTRSVVRPCERRTPPSSGRRRELVASDA